MADRQSEPARQEQPQQPQQLEVLRSSQSPGGQSQSRKVSAVAATNAATMLYNQLGLDVGTKLGPEEIKEGIRRGLISKGVNFDETGILNDQAVSTKKNLRRAGTHWKFEGSVEKLLRFLDARKDLALNPLSKERHQQLRNAVVALSDSKNQITSKSSPQSAGGLFADIGRRRWTATDICSAVGIHAEHEQDNCDIIDVQVCDLADMQTETSHRMTFSHSIDDDEAEELLMDEGWDVHAFVERCGNSYKDVGALLFMFEKPFDLVERYSIDTDALSKWVMAIREQYIAKNPYHNWTHALEVTQSCRYAVVTGGGDFLNYQDILALFCASIAHDVGHYGLTTPFLVRTGHDVAILYNDKSPMENMHAFIFFKTMLREGHTFLQVNAGQWKNFRRKVITAILSTDIAHHFTFVDRLMGRLEKQGEKPFMEDKTAIKDKDNVSKEDRQLLIEAFMHTTDLTHNFKPFSVNKIGLMNLENEWFMQGDEERFRGMPVSPNFDRHKDSAAVCQSFFLGSMVKPMLQALHNFVKEDYADATLLNLDTNKKCWEKAIKEHGKKTVTELVNILPANYGEDTKAEVQQEAVAKALSIASHVEEPQGEADAKAS